MTSPGVPIAEIFSQGEEVISGQVTDTNAAWLSQELTHCGFDVRRHTAVGDRLADLQAVLLDIASRSDCCICTGGLGPTQDDLTAEAVAAAFGLELRLDLSALEQIAARYARAGLPMPEVNRKQALLPTGALRLDNHWGTAPGFALKARGCWFAFLPGVPGEMRAMFKRWVVPELQQRFAPPQRTLLIFRCVGVGESVLQERLDRLDLPNEVIVGFRAALPEVHVKLLFPADFPPFDQDRLLAQVQAALGTEVFAVDGPDGAQGDLAAVVGRLLRQRDATIAAIETASGGQLASQCAGEPWFVQSLVVPDQARLCRLFDLEVPESGPACTATAENLAMRMRDRASAGYALAQLATSHNPAPLVHVALATPHGVFSATRSVVGDRQRSQSLAAAFSFDLLRRHLQGLPLK